MKGNMETEILKYIVDQAPQIAIVAVILLWQTKRMGEIEDRLCNMLDDCWRRYDAHINGEQK